MRPYALRHDEGILLLVPEERLEASGFASLESCGTMHGLWIRTDSFPGCKDFGLLFAHLKSASGYHHGLKKVAIAADGAFASVMWHIESHVPRARVKRFDLLHADPAWSRLRQCGTAQ